MSLSELLQQGESAPSAFTRNTPVGTRIGGKILATDVRQTRNYETQELETWEDGNPKKQVVIIVATGLSDTPDDDGRRGFYIKWWGDQRRALLETVKAAGDDDIRAGGTFYATYTGDGPQANVRLNPPKLYKYEYTPPSSTASLLEGGSASAYEDPWNAGPSAPSTPAQSAPATPAPSAPAAPAGDSGGGGLNEIQKAALRAAGLPVPGE